MIGSGSQSMTLSADAHRFQSRRILLLLKQTDPNEQRPSHRPAGTAQAVAADARAGPTVGRCTRTADAQVKPKTMKLDQKKATLYRDYIKEQHLHLQLLGSSIQPLRPDVGYYTTVDGLEIAEDLFPEEYRAVQEAWDQVATKIKAMEAELNGRT